MPRLPASDRRARHWAEVYRDTDEARLSWYEPEPRCSMEMLDAAGVHPDQPVIDIGTGASRLVDALLNRGFRDLTALDITPEGPNASAGASAPRPPRSTG